MNYHAFPQVNLASFIIKNDDSPFHNELFRNVDFLITDDKYKPLFIIEINDQTHLNQDRKERDEKVQNICDEAGIPIVKFWTSYGVNADYIKKKVDETISSLPIERIHHFSHPPKKQEPPRVTTPQIQYQPSYTYRKKHPKDAMLQPVFTDRMTAPRFGLCADSEMKNWHRSGMVELLSKSIIC